MSSTLGDDLQDPILALCGQLGISRMQLALDMGWSPSSLCDFSKRRGRISSRRIRQLRESFGDQVDVDAILEWQQDAGRE